MLKITSETFESLVDSFNLTLWVEGKAARERRIILFIPIVFGLNFAKLGAKAVQPLRA